MVTRYAFAEFIVEPRRRRLTRRGERVELGERCFEALLALLEQPGEVVSKRSLIDTVWPDAVVGEESLVKAVSELRAALDDTPAAPRYIQTVPRRGYRFVAEVREVQPEEDDKMVPAATPTWSWLSARLVALAAVAVAISVALALALWPRSTDVPFAGGSFQRLPRQPQSTFKPAFAHGSQLLAAVVADPQSLEHALWLIPPGSEAPLRLTHGIEVRGPAPVFSADDSRVLFTSYRHDSEQGLVPEVFEVPVLGGRVRRVATGASAVSPSPDGDRMAIAKVSGDGTAIVVRNAAGAEQKIAATGYWPRWSPNGRWIAYTTSNPEGGSGHLWIVRPDGRRRRQLTDAPTQLYGLTWTADSEWIVFSSERVSVGDLFAVSLQTGMIHQVTSGPGSCSSPAVSPDGMRLVFAYATYSSTLYGSETLDAAPQRLFGGEPVADLALSRDDKRLAVVLGASGKSRRVAVLDLRNDEQETVTGLDAEHVRWTPDDQSLLVSAPSPDRSTQWIWRVPLDQRLPTAVLAGRDHWQECDPSPDGQLLAAVRQDDDATELVIVELDTGTIELLHRAPSVADVRWSPDGRHLAFSGGYRPDDACSSGIWVIELGGDARRLSPDGAWPAWLGDEVVFARSTDLTGLWRVGLDGQPPRRVPRPIEDEWGFSVEGVEIGRGGSPLVVRLVTGTTSLYDLQRSP